MCDDYTEDIEYLLSMQLERPLSGALGEIV